MLVNVIHSLGPGIPCNVSVAAVNSAGTGKFDSEIGFTEDEGKLFYGFTQLMVSATFTPSLTFICSSICSQRHCSDSAQ